MHEHRVSAPVADLVPVRPEPDKGAIADCFIAFAAMMAKDYGVSKEVALKALALAYELNSPPSTRSTQR